MVDKKKNAAAYHVRRSAVKNIQREKRGIDITNEINPAIADHLGFCLKSKNIKATKKIISCIFNLFVLTSDYLII